MATLKNRLSYTVILLSVFIPSAWAINNHFFNHAVVSYYTKEDWKLLKNALDDALNHGKDGVKIAWNNPLTGNKGVVLPIHTTHNNGAECRDLALMYKANQLHEGVKYRFCKLNDQWKIV
jgi:surface antigen